MLGWGTDETALITILAHRDATQRKIIRLAFEEQYKENLIMRLESELSGDLEVPTFVFCILLALAYVYIPLNLITLPPEESCLPLDI